MSLKYIIGTLLANRQPESFLGEIVKIDKKYVGAIRTAWAEPSHFEGAQVFLAFSEEAVRSHQDWLMNNFLPKDTIYKKGKYKKVSQFVPLENAEKHLCGILYERIQRVVPVSMKLYKNSSRGAAKFTLQDPAHVDVVKSCIAAILKLSDKGGLTSCRPGVPLDFDPKILIKTPGPGIDFSVQGEIKGFRDAESGIHGKYYVRADRTAHVFFKHNSFVEEINGRKLRFPPDEHYQYFAIRPDNTISDCIYLENSAGMPIRESADLDRFIPKFLQLKALERLQKLQQDGARERGFSSIEDERARDPGRKIAAAKLSDRQGYISAEFNRQQMTAAEKAKQPGADRLAIKWLESKEVSKPADPVRLAKKWYKDDFGTSTVEKPFHSSLQKRVASSIRDGNDRINRSVLATLPNGGRLPGREFRPSVKKVRPPKVEAGPVETRDAKLDREAADLKRMTRREGWDISDFHDEEILQRYKVPDTTVSAAAAENLAQASDKFNDN